MTERRCKVCKKKAVYSWWTKPCGEFYFCTLAHYHEFESKTSGICALDVVRIDGKRIASIGEL